MGCEWATPARGRCTSMEGAGTSPGTTGFDVVESWGWLRAEVPEASLNPGKTIRADSHEYALAV